MNQKFLEQNKDVTNVGDYTDGYHTYNELYYHRAVLFSALCKAYNTKAWKSKKHDDGSMFDDFFIVGIDTPDGQITYHYELKLWDMFDVKEIKFAPKWDGHTGASITRLLSL